MPGLPATRPLHHGSAPGHGRDPPGGLQRRRPSTTPRASPSRSWPGCTSSCAAGPGASPARRRPGDARGPARRGHPRLVGRLRRRAGRPVRRGARRSAPTPVLRRLPRGLQGGVPRAHVGRRRPPDRGADRGRRHGAEPLHPARAQSSDERRFKVFSLGRPISLSEVLPVLQRLGVEVVDERPYTIERRRRVARVSCTTSVCAPTTATPRRRRCGEQRVRRLGGQGPVRGRLRGDLVGQGRVRRVQRAGAARRPDLAAGGGPARLREVPPAGRVDLQPGLRRVLPADPRPPGPAARAAVRGPIRPRLLGRPHRAGRGHRRGDHRSPRRGGQPRPRPHPAFATSR